MVERKFDEHRMRKWERDSEWTIYRGQKGWNKYHLINEKRETL